MSTSCCFGLSYLRLNSSAHDIRNCVDNIESLFPHSLLFLYFMLHCATILHIQQDFINGVKIMERRSLSIFLLAIGLFFLSSISEGANWEKITKSEDCNTSVFVDTKSIRHISKTFVRAWIKILFDKPFVFNSISTTKILDCVAIDCCENKIKLD